MNDTTRPAPPSAIRILLVDDHKTMLWGLEKLIEGAAADMVLAGTASNNATALAQAAALRPDIVVLDLDLEGQSAIDILPQLLAHSGARVLVLSGNRDHGVLTQAVRLGARGVIGKEAPAEVVLNAIRSVHRGDLCLDPALMTALLAPSAAPAKPDPEAARIATLTPKERKIVGVVVDGNGAPNKELAARLFIAEPTLRNNLTAIYHKLGVSNRLELYVYATRHGVAPD